MVVAELPWIAAETNALVALQQRRSAAHHPFPHGRLALQPPQPGAPPPSAAAVGESGGRVRFGLWDSESRISRLQLTVALSMATDVDETRVHVTVEDSHFFGVEVDGAPWLVDAVNGDAGFLDALNAQARAFDARLVVSHAAVRVVADGGAPPAAPRPPSPPAR
jgi:hypothetical protein